MRTRSYMVWGMLLLLAGMVSEAEAGPRRACRFWNCGVGAPVCLDVQTCQPCQPVCAPIQYQEVQCQVYVPHTELETRQITVTQYRNELQDRTITVWKHVPREVVQQVSHTVCDPVVREREVPVVTCRQVWEPREVSYTYVEPVHEQHEAVRTVMDPVWEDVTREYTVMVPRPEWHTGTRMVCSWQPVTVQRPICVDRGYFEDRVIGMVNACLPCGPCGPVQAVCRPIIARCWRPNLVTEHVPCTVMQPVQTPVEFQYCTMRFEPEVRTCVQRVCRMVPREVPYTYTTCRWVPKTGVRTVQVCRYVQETSSRVERYTEMVPRTEVRDVRSVVYDCVPEEKLIQVPVCVPEQVQQTVQVAVCKMVPQTVVRRIPVLCPTCP